MALIEIAALLSFGTASAALDEQPAIPLQPAPDAAEERASMRRFYFCLAGARATWARETLGEPYLSDAQARMAGEALRGRDSCMPGIETDMRFRTSTLVGSLAEYFISTQLRDADLQRVSRALATAAPLNVSEDFALCVAARDPQAARDLALSQPGAPAEGAAAQRLAVHFAGCVNPGERLTVDLQALRAMTSTALYRGMRTALATRN